MLFDTDVKVKVQQLS